MPLPNC